MPSVNCFRFVVVERSNFDFILANLKPGLIDLIPNNASSIKKTKQPLFCTLTICSLCFPCSSLSTKMLLLSSPHVSITHESLGFQIARCEFQISCQWNLKAGFQSLPGFRFVCAELRIPKPRVPVSTCKNFPEYGIRITIILRVIQPYSQYIRSSWEIIIN